MGFKEIKVKVLHELTSENGAINHTDRSEGKNLLKDETISKDLAAKIISRCRGTEYQCSPHHNVPGVVVHIMKPSYETEKWYIKFYFIAEKVTFISFRP